ncbi:MAG: type I-F CRISPR-associated protein Csy1 [Gammaproteobacteria bacterium]|nr:type I-F CRISPR-associated protein Csy1 [Gammaproteobacteria bacterium]
MSTVLQIRKTITTFIEQRLANQLERERDEGKRQELCEKYRPTVWIAYAAHRVKQIRLVTHAIKYSHPDARGSSLCSDGCKVAGEDLVGTHTLGKLRSLDVAGNAANLDVYKFLSLEVEGVPLWQRARDQDAALLAALPGNAEENQAWVESFASLAKDDPEPKSHALAKQVYWPLEEHGYHLLEPLFPTSLVQSAYDILQKARFSEEAKTAREARRDGKSHAQGFRDWPELLIQNFGGTKPQNISQLNSERHGEVWLLPSLPPSWKQMGFHPPLHMNTVFKRLPYKFDRKAEELGHYLASVRDWSNRDIRDGRARRVFEIIDDLIHFSFLFRGDLPAGWSADESCKLDEVERYWLDPNRDGEDFQQQCRSTDWPRDIADRFGKWLNSRLRKRYGLPVGDREHHEWLREFENELADHLRGIKNA